MGTLASEADECGRVRSSSLSTSCSLGSHPGRRRGLCLPTENDRTLSTCVKPLSLPPSGLPSARPIAPRSTTPRARPSALSQSKRSSPRPVWIRARSTMSPWGGDAAGHDRLQQRAPLMAVATAAKYLLNDGAPIRHRRRHRVDQPGAERQIESLHGPPSSWPSARLYVPSTK